MLFNFHLYQRKSSLQLTKMESDRGFPDEFVDTLVQDFAYDPIRLSMEEDPVQMLYDRKTLERIWDTKHDAVNPYTLQPFNISNAVPQVELRQQMSQYILENRSRTLTLDLDVIPDYTAVLSTIDMKKLLSELRICYEDLDSHCSTAIAQEKTGNMEEEKYWKALWKKLNLLRLYCEYRPENRETFSSIKGYEYFFKVVSEPLLVLCREYYSVCDYIKEVFREAARIVDIIGVKYIDLQSVPEKSVCAFVHMLTHLAELEYLKIQSMVLRIYSQLFFGSINYLLGSISVQRSDIFCNRVVETVFYLLSRENVPDITNEDLYNGMLTLKAGWIKNANLVLDSGQYVDVLVNMVIICVSRLETLHADAVRHAKSRSHNTGNDQTINIHKISTALYQGLSLIDWLIDRWVTDNLNGGHSFADQKARLQTLDIVKEIIRMVKLDLSGFKLMEPSHFHFGLNIARALFKQGGFNVISKKDVEIFRKFLKSNDVKKYGNQVKILLQGFIRDADALYLK